MKQDLVSNLTVLFDGLTKEEVDDAVANAMSLAKIDKVDCRIEQFSSLFDSQMQALRKRQYPDEVVSQLESQRDSVLAKAASIKWIGEGFPFLPVVPQSIMSIYDLLARILPPFLEDDIIIHSFDQGKMFLDVESFVNEVVVPSTPYFIYFVVDQHGLSTNGYQLSPLTAEEVIALVIHYDNCFPSISDRGNIFCGGSSLVFNDKITHPLFTNRGCLFIVQSPICDPTNEFQYFCAIRG